MKEKRHYRMSERAKSQEETRQKIVEATMHLHEEVGPRSTTISAIAERAGVQRLTVYRHFPDETAVFQACTTHWLSLNPPPNPANWSSLADGWARLRTALATFYAYYRSTRRMWTVSHRDVAEVPALQGPMAEFASFVGMVGDDLSAHLIDGGDRRSSAQATVRHALAFTTWAALDELGLEDAGKVALVEDWLRGVMSGSASTPA